MKPYNWQPSIVGPVIGGLFVLAIIVALIRNGEKKPEVRNAPPRTPAAAVSVPHTWTRISHEDSNIKVWRLDYDGKTFLLTSSPLNHTMLQVIEK